MTKQLVLTAAKKNGEENKNRNIEQLINIVRLDSLVFQRHHYFLLPTDVHYTSMPL